MLVCLPTRPSAAGVATALICSTKRPFAITVEVSVLRLKTAKDQFHRAPLALELLVEWMRIVILKSIALAFVFLTSLLAAAQPTSAARPAITGISHIALYADDIPKSQEFYQSLLG